MNGWTDESSDDCRKHVWRWRGAAVLSRKTGSGGRETSAVFDPLLCSGMHFQHLVLFFFVINHPFIYIVPTALQYRDRWSPHCHTSSWLAGFYWRSLALARTVIIAAGRH